MRDFHSPGRSTVFATNGMCATSHPLAAKVALQILEAGGNAADAAISAAVLLGLCEPQMTGIGGDCFVLIKPHNDRPIVALNGSGRAPAAATSARLRKHDLGNVPLHTADAVTIPGAIDAFCTLSNDWGRIGLKAALAPAIYYAEAGIPVAPRTAFDWNIAVNTPQGRARDHYLFSGKAPKPGQVFRAPGQAHVLRRICDEGRAGFYEGEVAQDMVASLQAMGGQHTLEDFSTNACDYTTPIHGDYKGLTLVEHPPNGQGATAILMNNILSRFDVAGMDPLGAQRVHLEAEAAKLAYETRNRLLADADHMTRLEYMLASDTAERLAKRIDSTRAMASAANLSESLHKETVYLTVVDRDRMMVSMIYSIFHSFGSGLASDRFGILFQNRGAGFTLEEGHPNELAGGKRPMHTIIPAMVREKGEVTMSFGVMGGAYQPNGHARFISNIADFGMDLQQAIDAPRSFADAGQLTLERGYSDAVCQELSDLGHHIITPDAPVGGAQAIRVNYRSGVLEGASDPRKDGCALGF